MTRLWIDDDAAFRAFVESLPPGQPVALDTEFDRTRTYYPVFALLQVGVGRECVALVDALALKEWSPLGSLLGDPRRRKYLFSASNDLPILHQACGTVPASVFDVQVAAGFCGESGVQGLKAVLERRLGIVLPKTETRSDWTRRPLSAQQLSYAGDDVAYLTEVGEWYESALRANGNLSWFQEEMEEAFCREEAYGQPPVEEAWRRLGFLHHHPGDPQAVRRAVGLAIWREGKAREIDCAKPRLLTEEQLNWCAAENPATLADLMKMPNCWPKRIRPHGQEILEVLAHPPQGTYRERAEKHFTPERKARLRKLSDRVMGIAASCARQRLIDPALACSRGDADRWATLHLDKLPQEGRICRGWRKELLQAGLDQIRP